MVASTCFLLLFLCVRCFFLVLYQVLSANIIKMIFQHNIIYVTFLYNESECVIVKYFKIRLIYFNVPEASKDKAWEWHILPYLNLLSLLGFYILICLL